MRLEACKTAPQRWRLLAHVTALALAVGAGACARTAEDQRAYPRAVCSCADTSLPVAPPILAWLSKARSLHHAADLAEDAGQITLATGHLDDLLRGPRPANASPEIDEVMADTRARLADLRSRQGAFSEALSDIDEGLRLARDATYFRGHLLEVEGLVHERQARVLGQQGNQTAAEGARAAAIRASIEAVKVQDEVIRRALGEAGARTKGNP